MDATNSDDTHSPIWVKYTGSKVQYIGPGKTILFESYVAASYATMTLCSLELQIFPTDLNKHKIFLKFLATTQFSKSWVCK